MFDHLDWMAPTVESIISWSTRVSIRVVRSSDPSQMFHFKVDLSREWLTIVEGEHNLICGLQLPNGIGAVQSITRFI